MKKFKTLIAIPAILLFAACGGDGGSTTYPDPAILGSEILQLTAVVDGDTLDFGLKRCRLHGIDTPEKYAGAKLTELSAICGVPESSIQILGDAASAQASAILDIGSYYEVETVGQDIYGRDVCIVEMQYGDLGGYMVNSGYAVVLEEYMDEGYNLSYYLASETDAKNYLRALWGVNESFMQCMTDQ